MQKTGIKTQINIKHYISITYTFKLVGFPKIKTHPAAYPQNEIFEFPEWKIT